MSARTGSDAGPENEITLFDVLPPPERPTQEQAHVLAARYAKDRYRQIIDLLQQRGPLAGWQIAEALECQLNQISGRISELVADLILEKTGDRRKNPRTQASGEIVRLRNGALPSVTEAADARRVPASKQSGAGE